MGKGKPNKRASATSSNWTGSSSRNRHRTSSASTTRWVPAQMCEGYGNVIGIDRELVIPDKNLSVYDDGVAPWRGEKLSEWKDHFIRDCAQYDFPIHRSIRELSEAQLDLLWKGARDWRVWTASSDTWRRRATRSSTAYWPVATEVRPPARFAMAPVYVRSTLREGGWQGHHRVGALPIVDCLSFFQELKPERAGPSDRGSVVEGDPEPATILGRCRSRLPDLGTAQQHLERRRDPTHRLWRPRLGSSLVGACTSWTSPASACTRGTPCV
jgi:hypothetical protein